MKKIHIIALLILTLAGCASRAAEPENTAVEEPQAISVLAPTGAPALSLIRYIDKYGDATVTISNGADALQAALLNEEMEYDAVIAPVNLGVNLILNKGSKYKLAGVVSWGNLYLVENDDLSDSDLPAAFFGESAVPGKVVAALDLNIKQEIQWYAAVSDVSAALLGGQVSCGILAEPLLSATLAKASQEGVRLSVVSDLQELFSMKYGTDGYPQAALFISESAWDKKRADVEDLILCISDLRSEDVEKIEGHEEFYGVLSVSIVAKAFEGMNVHYVAADTCKKELAAFLDLFHISDFDSVIIADE